MSQFALTDRLYLTHILTCIDNVQEDLAGGRDAMQNSRTIRDSVIRNLQVMTESSQRLSDAIKETEAAIPWKQIAGFRHRLVHDYFNIDIGLIWRVHNDHLPDLKAAAQRMLGVVG
ncbi:MAG TPA: DUF86 domain-containing protein [Tepidisphaeraceae bacterium]|nr:DUF86 domain-containing protein [Tepidisphaeraceae bacterium]